MQSVLKWEEIVRNIICWAFGCDVDIDWTGGTRYSPSRDAVVPSPINFCARRGLRDGDKRNKTSIGHAVDRRNIYRRTIPVWIMLWRNRRFSRHFEKQETYRQTEKGRREYTSHT